MSLKSFQTKIQKQAAAILDTATLTKLETALTEKFSTGCPEGAPDQENGPLLECLKLSREAVTQAISDLGVLEQYITLLVPQMEDGNNFGVTIQLAVLKQLKETAESLEKDLGTVPTYCKERADVMDKFLGSSSESVKEETNDEGTKKTTTKEQSTKSNGAESHRKEAVLAIDIQYYTVAKNTMQKVMTAYLSIIDFVVKNKDKIEMPKGSSGGSGYSSMY
eukprot:CAMPEP_0202442188 /NCGR_PEP_ID=MMETSP1360-20130828/1645_1 /ASSEMBLY_ACC=CAM_ASM_000848 /TAXON_ID=515479 /ORGANISM="Licmophora paradoxa, Strain CCMP2313" /LENGTH=220 /DNA_ID=CAMNT_0049057471 /DNA_START=39 /DNA_END=701 /DNA_ORIENTATION=+